MQETPVRPLGWEDPLAEEMAIHSSILAQEIRWTEETGRLQSMSHISVGHDLGTKQQQNNKTPFTANFVYVVPPPLNVINTGSGSIDMAFRKQQKNSTALCEILTLAGFELILIFQEILIKSCQVTLLNRFLDSTGNILLKIFASKNMGLWDPGLQFPFLVISLPGLKYQDNVGLIK